jgi:acyl dehydratase
LPFLAGGGGEVPEDVFELDGVAVELDQLAAYCRVCGFALRETLPATYPHVLAFPLHLALMTDPSFPVPAIGSVHFANTITQRRPIRVGEELSLRVRSTKLEPHPKGRTFTLVTEARVGDELVWESGSTNLRRGGSGGGEDSGNDGESSNGEQVAAGVDVDGLAAEAVWKLDGGLGRRYAAASGDRNPIHLYGLTAKAFGFPQQIAHGMWTKARCLAQLEPRLPGAFTVEVAFKRPILLPAEVEFASDADGPALTFGVRSPTGTPHLAGRVSP